MLKKSLAIVLLSLSTALFAGEMSEAAFKAWMSRVDLDGLKFFGIEKDGAKWQASFANPARPETGARFIALAPLGEFKDYQKMLDNPKMRMGPTQGMSFKGMRVVVVDTQSEIGLMAAVEARQLNRTVIVSFPSGSSLKQVEAGLAKTGLHEQSR